MGVLPLQYMPGESADSLNLSGEETFSIELENLKPQGEVTVRVNGNDKTKQFTAKVRIDTPKELAYYQHGGILHYVLRNLAQQ